MRTRRGGRALLAVLALPALLGAVFLGAVFLEPLAAASAPAASAEHQITRSLLTAAYARGLGFPKRVSPPTVTSQTGAKGCGHGGRVAYEDESGQTGLLSEVLVCTGVGAVDALLANIRSTSPPTPGLAPPRRLTGAVERGTKSSTYFIFWRHGSELRALAYDANIPASQSGRSTAATPITAGEQGVLARATLRLDR